MDNDDNTPPAAPAAPPPREKRPYHRRKVAPVPRALSAAPVKEPQPSKEEMLFAGMTAKLCASGCNPEKGCVISGDICVHPYISGGLQAPHQMKPAVKARFEAARDFLKHQAIDKRKEA